MSSQIEGAGTFTRDPVSELLDGGARQLLERAYASPGKWVSTRLADPSPAHVAYFAARGIDVLAADTAGRKLDARTRWARAYVRALYYQHQWHSELGTRGWRGQRRLTARTSGALKIDVGRHVPETGVIPAGRIVSVVLFPGGAAAVRAVEKLPDDSRIFTRAGDIGGAGTTPAARDW
jgi:hypothetical protein